jgi:hypothetical protein
MVSKADACQAQGIRVGGADWSVSWLVGAAWTLFTAIRSPAVEGAAKLLTDETKWGATVKSPALNSQEDNDEGL